MAVRLPGRESVVPLICNSLDQERKFHGVAAAMTVLGLSAAEDDKPVAATNKIFTSPHEIHQYFVAQGLSHK